MDGFVKTPPPLGQLVLSPARPHLEPDIVGWQFGQHVLAEPVDHGLPGLAAHTATLLRLDTEDRVQDSLGRVYLVAADMCTIRRLDQIRLRFPSRF